MLCNSHINIISYIKMQSILARIFCRNIGRPPAIIRLLWRKLNTALSYFSFIPTTILAFKKYIPISL